MAYVCLYLVNVKLLREFVQLISSFVHGLAIKQKSRKMVYVSSDGQLQSASDGWSLQRLKRTFWNFVDGFLLFFQTLLPVGNPRGNRYVTEYGRQQPSGGAVQRRIGRPGNVSGITAPPACGPSGG